MNQVLIKLINLSNILIKTNSFNGSGRRNFLATLPMRVSMRVFSPRMSTMNPAMAATGVAPPQVGQWFTQVLSLKRNVDLLQDYFDDLVEGLQRIQDDVDCDSCLVLKGVECQRQVKDQDNLRESEVIIRDFLNDVQENTSTMKALQALQDEYDYFRLRIRAKQGMI